MPVAALSTAGFSQYIAASSNVSASQQAWQTLGQSLAQGNLSAAQSAFAAYSKLNPAQTASSSNSTGSSQLSTDMAALGSALGSGNLSTAQSAFATVQSEMKSSPSQAVTNAETAVAQSVQWVDDLLSLSSANSSSNSTPVDPTTSILDSAYGQNSNSSATDPTTSILDSADGESTSSASSSGTAVSTSGTSAGSAPAIASSGNSGSAASVNAWA
jgi:hypothetical protein